MGIIVGSAKKQTIPNTLIECVDTIFVTTTLDCTLSSKENTKMTAINLFFLFSK